MITEDNTFGQRMNFIWEHFFAEKCGILQDDAFPYEHQLIANRLSPEDTIIQSLGIMIEVAKIPVGDKVKFLKTLSRHKAVIAKSAQDAADARKQEKYSALNVSVILETWRRLQCRRN